MAGIASRGATQRIGGGRKAVGGDMGGGGMRGGMRGGGHMRGDDMEGSKSKLEIWTVITLATKPANVN